MRSDCSLVPCYLSCGSFGGVEWLPLVSLAVLWLLIMFMLPE
jgi:hypothetical protein